LGKEKGKKGGAFGKRLEKKLVTKKTKKPHPPPPPQRKKKEGALGAC